MTPFIYSALPTRVAELGMNGDDIERAASIAADSPYPNPAPINREGLLTLLAAAFHGCEPREQTSFEEV